MGASRSLRGAAYRIRTYDALIRSQVLYPAEVTPRAIENNATHPPARQAKLKNVSELCAPSDRLPRAGIARRTGTRKSPPRDARDGLEQSGGELGIRTPDRICILYSLSRRAPSASRSALHEVLENDTPQRHIPQR